MRSNCLMQKNKYIRPSGALSGCQFQLLQYIFSTKKRKKTRRGTEDRNHNTIGLTQKPKTTTKSLRKYGLTVRVRGAARHRRRHLSTDDTHPKLYHESAIVRWTVPRAVDLQTAGRRFFFNDIICVFDALWNHRVCMKPMEAIACR